MVNIFKTFLGPLTDSLVHCSCFHHCSRKTFHWRVEHQQQQRWTGRECRQWGCWTHFWERWWHSQTQILVWEFYHLNIQKWKMRSQQSFYLLMVFRGRKTLNNLIAFSLWPVEVLLKVKKLLFKLRRKFRKGFLSFLLWY